MIFILRNNIIISLRASSEVTPIKMKNMESREKVKLHNHSLISLARRNTKQ